jgi:hypothetical protein
VVHENNLVLNKERPDGTSIKIAECIVGAFKNQNYNLASVPHNNLASMPLPSLFC